MPTRREFLKTTIIAGTVFALFRGSEGKIWAYAQSPKLRKFVAPLPGLGPGGIPVRHADAPTRLARSGFLRIQRPAVYAADASRPPEGHHPVGLCRYGHEQDRLPGPHRLSRSAASRWSFACTTTCPHKHILPVDTSLTGSEEGMPVEPDVLASPWRYSALDHGWRTLCLVHPYRHGGRDGRFRGPQLP